MTCIVTTPSRRNDSSRLCARLDQGSDEKSPTFDTYLGPNLLTPVEKKLVHTHNDYLLCSLNFDSLVEFYETVL
jgi:hypothetical protein